MHFKDSQTILDSIRRIVRALRLASRRSEALIGLNGAQLFVLQALEDGAPLTVNELAQRTFTHQSTVSTVAMRLERKGLLSRTRSKSDARRREIRITAAGRHKLPPKVELGQRGLLSGMSKLAPRDLRALSTLLKKLVERSGFSGVPASMFFEEDEP